MSDAAYQAKYLSMARLLWEAAEGLPERISNDYSNYLRHDYVDGSVSFAPLINKFDFADGLEPEEWDEAVEILGKVNPADWPFVDDIVSVDAEELLRIYDQDATPDGDTQDFIEDSLGCGEKCEQVLQRVIESVFGSPVEKIRSNSGDFPKEENKFLQKGDGTFAGTFMHGDHKFNFEIAPTESGWLCTYRMKADSLDSLPPVPNEHKDEDDETKQDYKRRVRARGWK
jgi:hypothetical protein